MELSERMREYAPFDLQNDDFADEVAQLEASLAEARAELAGNALMDAEAESFISGQELVPVGTLAEIADTREAVLLLLDHVDYMGDGESRACSFTEMVGAVLPKVIIERAKMLIGKTVSHPTKQEGNDGIE